MHNSDLRRTSHAPLKATEDEKLFVKSVHIFINVRDRLECLTQLLNWFERAGHENITLIDNASTYPPLLKFMESCPYRVVRLKRNMRHTALWRIPEFRGVLDEEWFVYTDPDVVPTEACPLDAVAYLYHLLQQFPNYMKAGLGLCLDDIPDSYHLKREVILWETGLYGREIAPGAFQADVDTTFALYRPQTPYITGPAMRTRGIYEARHLPWYVDSINPNEEERYYRTHSLPGVTTWNIYGDAGARTQISKVAGGIAAQIEDDSQAMLAGILNSKIGRMMSICQMVRRLVSKPTKLWRVYDYTTPAQAEQAIREIMTSDDWRTAWSIIEPLRDLKSKLRR